jgi:hypothetical protein
MTKILCAVFVVMVASVGYCAEEAKLGKDDFISTTVADVFNKVEEYTSGQKKIIDSNWKNAGDEKGQKKEASGDEMTGITIRSGTTSPSSPEKGK